MTVRPATRLALVFSSSPSVRQSSSREPSELSESSLLAGEAGSSELSDRIVSEETLEIGQHGSENVVVKTFPITYNMN